ncbi:MAG: glycosyltransferase [Candidatus Eremiobacteraeota bacterium]|nr:glycosyltransferase [Candidatus Eremiobacteraeota bacterium]
MIDVLIACSHLRWQGVWQRPNHILTRLARRLPVLVVEEPQLLPPGAECFAADEAVHSAETQLRRLETDGLTVLIPERAARPSDIVDGPTIAAVRAFIGSRNAAFWLYSPLFLPLAQAAPAAPLIYDKMDELAAFDFADPRIGAREKELLARAAVVFAGGRGLWGSVRERAHAGGPYPSGVDVAHYARARNDHGKTSAKTQRRGPHADVQQARRHPAAQRPVFGYVGVIDERLDLHLIAELASARPDAQLVFVGPIVKIDPATLPRADNITYVGQRAYAELPDIIATFAVALMPFALNRATRFISPTKTLEYLAAGRPVVSTPIADVIAGFADVVTIADRAAFPAAVAAAEHPDERRRERGYRLAATFSWDALVDRMVADLASNGVNFPAQRIGM